MSKKTQAALFTAFRYFAVIFVVMLGYCFFKAEFEDHVVFKFDLFQNLLIPLFCGVVGFATGMFGRSWLSGGSR